MICRIRQAFLGDPLNVTFAHIESIDRVPAHRDIVVSPDRRLGLRAPHPIDNGCRPVRCRTFNQSKPSLQMRAKPTHLVRCLGAVYSLPMSLCILFLARSCGHRSLASSIDECQHKWTGPPRL